MLCGVKAFDRIIAIQSQRTTGNRETEHTQMMKSNDTHFRHVVQETIVGATKKKRQAQRLNVCVYLEVGKRPVLQLL